MKLKEKIRINKKNIVEKNLKGKNGITLIALVVTIIVLLILAGVSIAMLTGEGGILQNARDARDKTGRANVIEMAQLDVLDAQASNQGKLGEEEFKGILAKHFEFDPDTKLPEDLSKLTLTTKDGKYTDIKGNEIYGGSFSDISEVGLKIGDYVNYTPDKVTKPYDKLKKEYTGMDVDDQISQEDLDWRVLNINDDGSIDLISSETNAQQNTIALNGVLGYNNGVYLLNDFCKTLYSRGDIKARSVNLEDMEKHMTKEGLDSRFTYFSKYNSSYVDYGTKVTTRSEILYPDIFNYEVGNLSHDGIGIGQSESYSGYNGLTTKKFADPSIVSAESTAYCVDSYYGAYVDDCDFLWDNLGCWIATRGINVHNSVGDDPDDEGIDFGLYYYTHKNLGGGAEVTTGCLVRSDGREWDDHWPVRAVVTLPPSVEITLCEGMNNKENPHKIKEY